MLVHQGHKNLGVVCDDLHALNRFLWYFNLFVLEGSFHVPKRSSNLGNRSLCGLELGFSSEIYHEAELLNNLDEFFHLNQILVSFMYS